MLSKNGHSIELKFGLVQGAGVVKDQKKISSFTDLDVEDENRRTQHYDWLIPVYYKNTERLDGDIGCMYLQARTTTVKRSLIPNVEVLEFGEATDLGADAACGCESSRDAIGLNSTVHLRSGDSKSREGSVVTEVHKPGTKPVLAGQR